MVDPPRSFEDVQRFVEIGRPEDRSLEYKQVLHRILDPKLEAKISQRKELARDICAMANTIGGTIVFGVKEREARDTHTKKPECIVPLREDLGKWIETADQVLANLCDPALNGVSFVQIGDNGEALLCHIERSWIGPHRVKDDNDSGFYYRTTTGKERMDTAQIRQAFLNSNSVYDRILSFQKERIDVISGATTAFRIRSGPTLVTHFIPVSTFAKRDTLLYSNTDGEHPLLYTPDSQKRHSFFNADGICTVCGESRPEQLYYVQAFRNGASECIRSILVSRQDGANFSFPMLECTLVRIARNALLWYKELGIPCPIMMTSYLTGMRDSVPSGGLARIHQDARKYELDSLPLPAVQFESFTSNIPSIRDSLGLAITVAWQAYGFRNSAYESGDGSWDLLAEFEKDDGVISRG